MYFLVYLNVLFIENEGGRFVQIGMVKNAKAQHLSCVGSYLKYGRINSKMITLQGFNIGNQYTAWRLPQRGCIFQGTAPTKQPGFALIFLPGCNADGVVIEKQLEFPICNVKDATCNVKNTIYNVKNTTCNVKNGNFYMKAVIFQIKFAKFHFLAGSFLLSVAE